MPRKKRVVLSKTIKVTVWLTFSRDATQMRAFNPRVALRGDLTSAVKKLTNISGWTVEPGEPLMSLEVEVPRAMLGTLGSMAHPIATLRRLL